MTFDLLKTARAASQRVLDAWRQPLALPIVAGPADAIARPDDVNETASPPVAASGALSIFAPPNRRPAAGSDGVTLAIKSGANLSALRPELTRIYGDVADAWSAAGGPQPEITSGNDGQHM